MASRMITFPLRKKVSKYVVINTLYRNIVYNKKFQGALKGAILMYKQYHITGYNFEDDVNDFAYVADNVA